MGCNSSTSCNRVMKLYLPEDDVFIVLLATEDEDNIR
jgi:hypothetical protein